MTDSGVDPGAGPKAVDEAVELEAEALEVAGSTAVGSNSLLGAALLGSGATLIVGALGVLRTKVLAVGLEPSGLGLYGQILTLLTALSAASGLGLGLGTTRVVAERRKQGDRDGLKAALEVSFALPFAVAALAALAVMASSVWLAPVLLDDGRALLLVLAAVAVPVIALQGPLVHAVQGFRDVAGAQAANLLFGITLTVASVAGVLVAGLEGAVIGLVAGNLAYALALAWRLRGLLRRGGVARLALTRGLRLARLRDPVIRTMLGVGLASLIAGIAAGVGELVVRTVVLRTVSADAAGIFQALQLISLQLVAVIVTSLIFLSFTSLSEAHASGDRGQAVDVVDRTLRLALLLVLPVLMVLGVFREEVVKVFLSASFGEVSELLPRQLVGDTLRTIAFALGAALVPLGHTRAWLVTALSMVVVYVALAAWLVPSHGLDGAVLAYIAQWACAVGITVAVMVRYRLLALSPLTLRTLAAAVAVVGVLLLPAPPLWAALPVVVVFSALLVALGTSAPERAALLARARAALPGASG